MIRIIHYSVAEKDEMVIMDSMEKEA